MASEQHLAVLNTGISEWNKWILENESLIPDLTNADLSGRNLQSIILRNVLLNNAKLSRANFAQSRVWNTSFCGCDLRFTNYTESKIVNSDFTNANIQKSNFSKSHVTHSCLKETDLEYCDFTDANLSNSDIRSANLVGAIFENTDVREIRYNRWAKYQGVRVSSSFGSARFRRFAQDQDFIEEFRSMHFTDFLKKNWGRIKLRTKKWRFFFLYLPWLVTCDCGRSFALWALWCVAIITFYAMKLWTLGQSAYYITNNANHPIHPYDFHTVLYQTVVTFSTVGFGDIVPVTPEAKNWVIAEIITGYLMLGGLISIFSNKFARRS